MAIKIIKPGRLGEIKRFTCSRCGCVFMADVDDCEVAYSLLNGYYFKIDCPCCGYIIRKLCNE